MAKCGSVSKKGGSSSTKGATLSLFIEMFGDYVVYGADLGRIPISRLVGEGTVVGVYFSGDWCPPSKIYTAELVQWYEKFKRGPNAAKLEIIFVSSDKSEAQFMQYFMTMPWTALPYVDQDKKVREFLSCIILM